MGRFFIIKAGRSRNPEIQPETAREDGREVSGIIKKDIRKQYIDIRNGLDKQRGLQYSQSIAGRLAELECVLQAVNVMCFVSFGSEVYTHSVIKDWLLEGKNVFVPCIESALDGVRRMHAVKIRDFGELSKAGSYGIPEPPLVQGNIAAPESLDVIVVPGSVFDLDKNRLGYGGGFYDKYLAGVSDKCKKIGVCYDFQVIEHIPHDEHDIPLDMLVTEKRIII